MTIPHSLFVELWQFHLSFMWKKDIKMLFVRVGKRPFKGKWIRIAFTDPSEEVQKKALELTTTAYKLQHLPQDVKRRFQGMTPEDQVKAIQKYEEEMDPKKHDEIQAFVIEQRKKGLPIREVKRLVKKKFKVDII